MVGEAPSELSYDTRSIEIFSILGSSFQQVWRNRHSIARLIIIPLGVSFLTRLALEVLQDSQGSPTLLAVCAILPWGVSFTMFAVACHRLILLHEQVSPRIAFTRWSMRETRFLGWSIGIMLLAVLAAAITSPVMFVLSMILGWLGGLLAGIVGYDEQGWAVMGFATVPLVALVYAYIVGRISLVLPGTAIDLRPSLGDTWLLTEKNDLRLMVLLGVIPTISIVTGAFVEDMLFAEERSWFLLGFSSLLEYATVPVEIAILSLAFRDLANSSSMRIEAATAMASSP